MITVPTDEATTSMIDIIRDGDAIIAIVVSRDHRSDGIEFFTPESFPLQIGHMTRPTGYRVVPHIHNPVERTSIGTQEALLIKAGAIRLDLYTFERRFLTSRQLSAGDVVLLAGAGHGIEVIEEATIVEVKNGPYVAELDKGRFEPTG